MKPRPSKKAQTPARNVGQWARTTLSSLVAATAMSASVALFSLPMIAPAHAADDPVYVDRFMTQYNKIKNPANGYFSAEGVPYHSVETLMVEAPDYGHETTSEAYSFWIWMEAQYGRVTGDWAPLKAAWANMEKYMIPTVSDQPTNSFYNPAAPATYASEFALPKFYPAPITSSVPSGKDPIGAELASTYGNKDIYGMHWLLDVDNWYGYGKCGDGTTRPSYINTFQRGEQESVWETVPHPSCDTFKWGRDGNTQGFLSLFIGDSSYAKQWRYTNAPDADARAIQAIYWANEWAKAQGKGADVADIVKKAAKMGDFLRYAMFDKYFKKIGCGGGDGAAACAAGTGAADANGFRDNEHYLMSWYYAWGGALDAAGGWAWRVGSSHNHFGYQNPFAAWALSTQTDMKPLSPTANSDWTKSFQRQLELYRWLQSADGAIAGGATNSLNGNYTKPAAGTSTFYGMAYQEHPVYHDPGSNQWFGMQVWSMHRVAELYYVTGNASAKALLDKWVPWAIANSRLFADGTYEIPSTLQWSGQPDTWNAAAPGANANLRVTVTDFTNDVGTTAAFARTLMYYAAKANHAGAKTLAKGLLDGMWASYQDPLGVSVAEVRTDYNRFDDAYDPITGSGVYVPPGWTGTNAQGAVINSNSTFISMRPKYKQDPQWPKIEAYLAGGPAPSWNYHRFWAQSDVAMAMADYGRLFGTTVSTQSIVVSAPTLSVAEGGSASFTAKLSVAPTANVTVAVAKAAGGDADLTTATTSLTFTPANWNVAQSVTVAAAEDADSINGSATFNLTAAGATSASVAATEADNDPLPVALVVAPATMTIDEGTSKAFQVRLSGPTTSNVTVTVARTGGDTDISVLSGATLTFTSANWNIMQNVTLAAAEDADTTNGTTTFAVSAPTATTVSVTATEIDNDVPTPVALVVTGSPITVNEGSTKAFQVKLSAAPAANVTVTVARTSGDTDLSVSSGATLTFTPANWNVNQNVTLAAAEDADTTNGTASFSVSSTGLTSVAVAASEVDNDPIVTASCTVTVNTSNDWGAGQVPTVKLSNGGTTPITGWSVSWTESNDFTLSNYWSSTVTKTGRSIVATPANWNATVPANGSVEFGMQIAYSGAKPMPTNLKWDGRDCTIVVQ